MVVIFVFLFCETLVLKTTSDSAADSKTHNTSFHQPPPIAKIKTRS